MIVKRHICTQCGKEHLGEGRLGMSLQCSCGIWIPAIDLDKARYYWIAQISITFAMATFFFAFIVFFNELPKDNWQRFFSPLLQVPSFTIFVISIRQLIRYKRTSQDNTLLYRYYLQGIVLMSVAILISILRSTL
jgi:hypothetical protein